MECLRVSLFGRVRVTLGSRQREVKLTRTTRLLFAFLLIERDRFHPRESLAGLFWGGYNQDRARRCLNTALWRLRNALESVGLSENYLLTSSSGDVGFNEQSNYWLDVAVFEDWVGKILKKRSEEVSANEIRGLDKALKLYDGDLLECVYDDWALRAREQKRLLYLKGLAYSMHYHHIHGSFQKSLAYGEKILSLDPLQEQVHREMMKLYVESGQRSFAIRQYERCCQVLDKELEIPPTRETEALFRQILSGRHKSNMPESVINPSELQQAIKQLKQASHHFELASQQFKQAIQYLEAYK
jgi:DNA-binding SARP family transcriptional activator